MIITATLETLIIICGTPVEPSHDRLYYGSILNKVVYNIYHLGFFGCKK